MPAGAWFSESALNDAEARVFKMGVFGAVILLILRQYLNAAVFFGICALVSAAMAVAATFFAQYLTGEKGELPVNFSYLLILIVGLLGIEWLARKLLRLA